MEAAQDGEHVDATELGARLRFAFEMVETGVAIMRQNLRRQHPEASDDEIQSLLNAWLAASPAPLDPNLVVRETALDP